MSSAKLASPVGIFNQDVFLKCTFMENMKFIIAGLLITIILGFNKLCSQSIVKDTLCKYINNLTDSNLLYLNDPKDIPKKIFQSIRKREGKRIKIELPNSINFSDLSASDKTYGLIYYVQFGHLYYMMLKQTGFAPSYFLKIFIEEKMKI